MRVFSRRVRVAICAGALLNLFAAGALAHSGHIGHLHESVFTAGFMHPLTGMDHLLAMVAVGLWGALSRGSVRQAVLASGVFLIMMFVGAMLGVRGVQVPMVEPMIMASLLIFGLLVASRRIAHDAIGFALVGLFAVFHGVAHGMELAAGSGVMPFVAGFMLATLALHMIGLFGGFQLKGCSAWLSRMLGGSVAAYGLLLIIGA